MKTVLTLADGSRFHIRRLLSSDAVDFGLFLESLSHRTRQRFEPHGLKAEDGRRIAIAQPETLSNRHIALDLDKPCLIAAYVLAELSIPDDEVRRYIRHGRPLGPKVARIAPVVADYAQNRGLGKAMIRNAIKELRNIGIEEVVLFGGVQTSNTRAIHVYEQIGFRGVGFHRNSLGAQEQDMIFDGRSRSTSSGQPWA
jgi:diamine N-acetyltransferase